MLKLLTPVEHEGFNSRTLVMLFDVPSKDFDLMSAVKAAAKDYCLTEEGKHVYTDCNCHNFNWADFDLYVPNTICEKHGFKKVDLDAACCDEFIDLNEQLVDEEDILGDDEE